MIQIPRFVARQVRAVCRRAVRKWPKPAVVSLHGSAEVLRVCLHHAEIPLEYRQAGAFPALDLSIPFSALAEFEGTNGEVTLEPGGPGKVLARWQDGGVPRVVEYEVEALGDLPEFPAFPEQMASAPPGFLGALAAATACVARDIIRYSTDHIQLRGQKGEVVSTDGRQALIQSGFRFPWTEDVLVPASPVFGCKELAEQDSVTIGRTEKHVTLKIGPWTLWLLIGDGRFPKVDEAIPKLKSNVAHWQIDPQDGAFLASALPRLPGRADEYSGVTVELNGSVAIRAREAGQGQVTEVALSRSNVTGKPVRVALDRQYLARALRLGLQEAFIIDSASPLLFRGERRTYVVMPLDKEAAIPPSDGALRIDPSHNGTPTKPKPERRTIVSKPEGNGEAPAPKPTKPPSNGEAPTPEPAEAPAAPAKPARRKSKSAGLAGLIQEAEALRAGLRDQYGRASSLVAALKHHRKQSKLVKSSLEALRQLQHIDA